MANRIVVTVGDDGSVATEINPTDATPVVVTLIDDSVRHDTPKELYIAAICHEANRQYCRKLGDETVPAFKDTSGQHKASLIEGVRAVQAGEITTPEQSHARWMQRKTDAGWTYGPSKDSAAKVHPNLVPFAELAPEQRVKDHLFIAIATTLLAAK